MASTRASISKVSKRPKINIIPPKQLFVDLTQDDTKTPSPKLPNSSPSAPNAPSKTPSTKDTSSSSIDYIPKSPTSSTSPSPNGYLNPSTSPPPRVSPPPPTQDNASMDITLTLSPNTPLDVQFDTPSPSPPIIAHPIPWNFLEAHGTDNAKILRKRSKTGQSRTRERKSTQRAGRMLSSQPMVQDQNVQEEIKESGLESMKDITFDQIMDEIDQKNTDAEKAESPYDTESEFKIIKSFQAAAVSDAFDSVLRSMPDDDLASLIGFETSVSIDNGSQEGTAETFYASADKPAQSNPLGHLHEELCTLTTKDSIKHSVSESIEEKLPLFDAQVQQTLKDQLLNIIIKPMNKAFNAFNTLESHRGYHYAYCSGGETVVSNIKQAQHVNEENIMVLHTSVKKSSEEDISEKKETNDEPLVKKLKFLVPTSSIPSPTPLKFIMPEPLQKPDATKMTMDQFTEHLTKTTSSIFSPTPPREPTPPRDPTPLKDESKGKDIAIENPQRTSCLL
ncbi:hypothetical protein Tco_1045070 [Tanacetum coccineum]|uniref:Uncharacterized protein n=1 Tax=Tanacetum coccineum TaxID=301880 RepID=A0ABQ5GSS8_9ASTR